MKRFDLETTGRAYMQREEMVETDDGEWVRFADVEAYARQRVAEELAMHGAECDRQTAQVHAERDRLRAALKGLRARAHKHSSADVVEIVDAALKAVGE